MRLYAFVKEILKLTPKRPQDHSAGPTVSRPLEANHKISPSAEPIHALAIAPFFDLAIDASTLALSCMPEHPVQLLNPLNDNEPRVATYKFINENTEKYESVHSLAFTRPGDHFIAGSNCTIAYFDINKSGSGPIYKHYTTPFRRKRTISGGFGYRGIVSTLDISCQHVLATGSFNKWLSLYANEGNGSSIAAWQLPVEDNTRSDGSGITQVKWSPCGQYLYVGSRGSERIIVYDIRVTGKELGLLAGRKTKTMQRINFDIVHNVDGGHDIWSGGTDGVVRIWKRPWETTGLTEASTGWKAHEESIPCVEVHPNVGIAATCSGQRQSGSIVQKWEDSSDSEDINQDELSIPIKSQDDPNEMDQNLRLWAV